MSSALSASDPASTDGIAVPRAFIHRAKCPRYVAFALNLFWGTAAALLLATPSWSDSAEDAAADVPAPDASGAQASAPGPGKSRWFDLANAPFIPVPEIAVDPNSGTTLGILPVWVRTDEHHDIRRIIAPDVTYNPNFGFGFHARLYAYPSEDEQWSVVAGAKQRVERTFDAEYQSGRLREQRWSFIGSLIYDRDGTPRFFGIGNESPAIAETNYTNEQELAQAQIGLNFNRTWQLLYTGRMRVVDVTPGTLARIASIEPRFGRILGVGTNRELLNRLSIVYDTRDDLTVPSRGMKWVVYGGLASRSGVFNDSLYSEAGVDGRAFWPIAQHTTLAAHLALRYLPTAHRVPFWALSSIGGGRSVIGGAQPLRGFGAGRFYDRNSFSATVELRRTVLSFNAISTHVELELAPFVDLGRVFARSSTWPVAQLHRVYGLGFRGIARPSVVGYVDIGFGSEGMAVFTGIDYPF
jgi:hypothetical protein